MSLLEIGILSLVEIVGDFALKEFANVGGIMPLFVGICGYIGVVIALIISLQGSTILMVNGAWDGMSAIMESVAAYVFLGERFEHTSQYMGLLFIVSGLLLLKIPTKRNFFKMPKIW